MGRHPDGMRIFQNPTKSLPDESADADSAGAVGAL
jgi:hypothetical protein